MLDQLLKFAPNIGLDALLLLPVLIALEAVLSADNAIALAAIARGLESKQMQRNALNVGLVAAFVLRIILILTATWIINFWQFELLGALYLLWLVFQYFTSDADADEHHHGPRFATVWQAIPMIALTDLAFSLDSVTTAIALSKETWLVITGGLIGVITLRFLAGLFIRWLQEYEHLEDAGFVTVGLVGLRLLIRVINPDFVPSQWVMVVAIASIFFWGFSKRSELHEDENEKTDADHETDADRPLVGAAEASSTSPNGTSNDTANAANDAAHSALTHAHENDAENAPVAVGQSYGQQPSTSHPQGTEQREAHEASAD